MAARRAAKPAHCARGTIRGPRRVSRALGAFAESAHLEPDAHQLPIGPVANVHPAAEGNPAAARHSHPHMGNSVCNGRGFTGAIVLGTAIAAVLWWWERLYKVLDPYLVVANAMPKTAFVPIFYLWLGASLSIYGMSLAISLFITILMIYSRFQGIDPNKVKL